MSDKVIIGDATLYHGDCMEILPTLGMVDAVVTDPPYGINLNTDNSRFSGGTAGNIAKRGNGIGTANGQPIAGDSGPFDPAFLVDYGNEQIIWGWHCFPDKLPAGACLVWIKRHDAAFGSFLSDAETCWFSRGHGVYLYKDISHNRIAKIRQHPTQKPVELMRWCIGKLMKTSNVICDPFMGSGTTGVACAHEKTFIGIEKERKYFDIACERIEAAYAQGRLAL